MIKRKHITRSSPVFGKKSDYSGRIATFLPTWIQTILHFRSALPSGAAVGMTQPQQPPLRPRSRQRLEYPEAPTSKAKVTMSASGSCAGRVDSRVNVTESARGVSSGRCRHPVSVDVSRCSACLARTTTLPHTVEVKEVATRHFAIGPRSIQRLARHRIGSGSAYVPVPSHAWLPRAHFHTPPSAKIERSRTPLHHPAEEICSDTPSANGSEMSQFEAPSNSTTKGFFDRNDTLQPPATTSEPKIDGTILST